MWLFGGKIHVKRVGGEMRSIWRIWALMLLALAVQSWATCTTTNTYMYATGNKTCTGDLCIVDRIEYYDNYRCDGGYLQAPKGSCNNGNAVRVNYACRGGAGTPYFAKAVYTHCQSWGDYLYYDRTICTTKCEADSAAHYSSCVSQANHFWDSDSCKCRERTEADSVFTVCTEDVRNGSPYYQIYLVTIHYKDGQAETACGVSPSLINGEGYKQYCPMARTGSGTCAKAGVPNGPSEPKPCNGNCSSAGGDMLPSAECYATVGYTCYMKDLRTGNTFRCDCDGSCSKAMLDLARPLGEGASCRNPYNNPSSSPSSSDSGGSGGSSDSGNSSDSGGSSSPSSSTGAAGDYTQQLDQLIANTQGIMNNTGDISQWTQTTMNNTTDIKNNLSDIGIDVNHIRTNTENTANNTANIDNKLSTTNSLLNDIKNKDWNPTINVEAPNVEIGGDTIIINNTVSGDTNIINVTTDTSKAPAEILGLLQNALQGVGNSSDTNGMGAQIDGWMGKIDSLIGDTSLIRMNGDSLNHAMDNLYSGGYGAIRDTLGNSSIADSMDAWTNKLVDNGKISGDGSDQCPSVLSRTWRVDFPVGNSTVGVDIGPLGRYLCNDVAGLGITFWALCRVILRAIVAIGCMIWLYRTALGIDGGSNEED